MDSASPARLREIFRLASSPGIVAQQRHLLEEAKAILAAAPTRPADTITVRFCSSTQLEPAVVTLRIPEGWR
jgi:hypothetical protein